MNTSNISDEEQPYIERRSSRTVRGGSQNSNKRNKNSSKAQQGDDAEGGE